MTGAEILLGSLDDLEIEEIEPDSNVELPDGTTRKKGQVHFNLFWSIGELLRSCLII